MYVSGVFSVFCKINLLTVKYWYRQLIDNK